MIAALFAGVTFVAGLLIGHYAAWAGFRWRIRQACEIAEKLLRNNLEQTERIAGIRKQLARVREVLEAHHPEAAQAVSPWFDVDGDTPEAL